MAEPVGLGGAGKGEGKGGRGKAKVYALHYGLCTKSRVRATVVQDCILGGAAGSYDALRAKGQANRNTEARVCFTQFLYYTTLHSRYIAFFVVRV